MCGQAGGGERHYLRPRGGEGLWQCAGRRTVEDGPNSDQRAVSDSGTRAGGGRLSVRVRLRGCKGLWQCAGRQTGVGRL
jgi:hypothetical protein